MPRACRLSHVWRSGAVAGRPVLPRPSEGGPASAEAVATRVTGDALRRSLKFTLLAWVPGAFWQGATGNTAITPLGKYLGANDLIFSLIIVAAPLLSALLQIPGSLVVNRLGRRKAFFIWTVTPHRALYILIGLLPWVFPTGMSTAVLMAGIVFVSMGLNNFGGQAWVNWMADLVPPRIRGKFFLRRSRMGIGVVAIATVLVATILDCTQWPSVVRVLEPVTRWAGMPPLILLLSLVFIAAGAIGMLDILLFAKVTEPAMRLCPGEPLSMRLSRPLKDQQFRRFVTYWSVWTCRQFMVHVVLDALFPRLFDARKIQRRRGRDRPGGATICTSRRRSFCQWGSRSGSFWVTRCGGGRWTALAQAGVLGEFDDSHADVGGLDFSVPHAAAVAVADPDIGGIIGGGCDIAVFNMMLHFNRKGGSGYQAVGTVVFSLAGACAAILAGTLGTRCHRSSGLLRRARPGSIRLTGMHC